MGLLRLLLRVPLLLLFVAGGSALILATTRHPAARDRSVSIFCRGLLVVLGVETDVRGRPESGPVLVVANHVSWLDVILLRAQLPAAFIAKSEVARWPLVGALVARTGNLFVERYNIFACYRSLPTLEAELQVRSVVVFPEATTTPGSDCAPYHGMFLESAVRTRRRVQPVVLRYLGPDGAPCTVAPFVGDDSLLGSLLGILSAPRVRARVVWQATMPGRDRRQVAQECRDLARAVLNGAEDDTIGVAGEEVLPA